MEPSSGERIEDTAAATEAAYAEKPARDYLAEYKEQLTPEAQQALNWIASEEARKALENYDANKNAENPVIRVLREKALNTLEFDLSKAADELKSQLGYLPDRWIDQTGAILEQLGKSLIEDILKDETSNNAKLSALRNLGFDLLQGALASIERQDRSHTPGYFESYDWGLSVSEVTSRGELSNKFVTALTQEEDPKHEIVLSILNEAHLSYPDPAINKKLDRNVESCGYIWDSKQNKYLKL